MYFLPPNVKKIPNNLKISKGNNRRQGDGLPAGHFKLCTKIGTDKMVM